MASYVAVKVYGPGHVVAYNYVATFPRRHRHRDLRQPRRLGGGRTARSTRPRSTGTSGRSSIDFYNNYMTNFHDNPFETDGGMHNVRVMRNMMINSRVARVLQPAGDRRTGLLDREHRLPPAGRIERG